MVLKRYLTVKHSENVSHTAMSRGASRGSVCHDRPLCNEGRLLSIKTDKISNVVTAGL